MLDIWISSFWPVNKADTFCYIFYRIWFGFISELTIDQITYYVLMFYWFHLEFICDWTLIGGSFENGPMLKEDTLCYLLYWLQLGFILNCANDWSIHYVLATKQNQLKTQSAIEQCFKKNYVLDILLSGLWSVNKADTLLYLICFGYH